METPTLQHPADFAGWRRQARRLLVRGVGPEQVSWQVSTQLAGLYAGSAEADSTADDACADIRVPRSFLPLAETVVCHRESGRFAVLYRVLWRLTHGEHDLLEMATDADIKFLDTLRKSVEGDRQRMITTVQFRRTPGSEREHYSAWFEPKHHILRHSCEYFRQRYSAIHWSIYTPEGCAHWNRSELVFGPPVVCADPQDRQQSARRYAMDSGFPVPLSVISAQSGEHVNITSLDQLRRAARNCDRCPHACDATQLVFGQGDVDARIMLVGEQPGDIDDVRGRPFVGQTGKLLRSILQELRVDEDEVYFTHAVKHFKYTVRGRRRIPQFPTAHDIDHCRSWLLQEIALVKPRLVIALGATAAQAVLGYSVDIQQETGNWRSMSMPGNGRQFAFTVTEDPATVLGANSVTESRRRRERLRQDIAEAIECGSGVSQAALVL